MRVLAVDPGYDRLGVAVLEPHKSEAKEVLLYSGCIVTDRKDNIGKRLGVIGQEFKNLLKKYQPDSVAVENLFFNKNQKTAVVVAEARGVVVYLAETAGCDLYEFGPQEIKVAVTGYGKSDKKQVIEMVKRLVPDAPDDALDDEYDAIAVGITAIAHNRGGVNEAENKLG